MKPSSRHIVDCKHCPALICWALTTANGKKQPVDAKPNNQGNLAVSRGADDLLYVRSLTKAHPELKAGEWRAMPHHATCTNPPPRRSSTAQRRPSGVRPVRWQR
ncbi:MULTISPECIES: hypothetical protein [unclassified Streptomyces]|uniref:hypothetical protein n=1 Tax=unclassified Streptomyces TaxID=2593676 RepID=UPI0034265AF2